MAGVRAMCASDADDGRKIVDGHSNLAMGGDASRALA